MNIADAEDAFLLGSTEWEQFMNEFDLEWYQPLAETFMIAALDSIPDEVKQFIPPELLERAESMRGGLRNANNATDTRAAEKKSGQVQRAAYQERQAGNGIETDL